MLAPSCTPAVRCVVPWRAAISVQILCEHALGPRVLLNTAGELLHAGAQKALAQLDDKLYLEVCGQAIESSAPKRVGHPERRRWPFSSNLPA